MKGTTGKAREQEGPRRRGACRRPVEPPAWQALLIDAIDSISEGFALFDPDERLVLFNGKWQTLYPAMLGLPRIGMTFSELVRKIAERGNVLDGGEDPADWARERIRRFREAPGAWERRLPDGHWIRVNEYRTAGGGTVAIHANITELKNREQAARDSEQRLSAVVETAAEGIVSIGESGLIESFNPAARRMFGYTFDEVADRNVSMLIPAGDAGDRGGTPVWLTGGENNRPTGAGRELLARRRDGTTFPVELTLSEMVTGGRRHFTGFIRDITEPKAAQETLVVAKEAAEEANLAKTRFLNTMSHELRTPLTALLGNLEYLSKYEDTSRTELKEVLGEMSESGHHLLTLINDLLDFSRIEAGKMKLTFENVLASEVVASVVSTFQTPARRRGLELRTIFDVDPVVRADPVRLKQILFNLVGNAVKFTDRGEICVRVAAAGDETTFTVSDTGCGIPEAQLPHIFETFRQIDNSSTRRAGGTGLGLAITKYLVDKHDGTISVESRLGEGSSFTFSLPRAAAEAGDR